MNSEKKVISHKDYSVKDYSMIVKFWGVRGSIPAPLDREQVREKQASLLREIIAKGGIAGALGFKDEKELKDLALQEKGLEQVSSKIHEFLGTLPESVSGTYGGETTCVEIQAKDSPLMLIDSGSGARKLGNYLLSRLFSGKHLNPLCEDESTKREIHLFLTHYHWDHLQGFPFFAPGFIAVPDKKVDIKFYGKRDGRNPLSEVLKGQQEFPNFPVTWDDMPCTKDYTELGRLHDSALILGASKIRHQELTHPDAVFAYRIDCWGKSFVLATDTEHKDSPDPRLVNLAKNADVLYYDSQYSPDEYAGKKGMNRFDWGHSTYIWAVKNALAADVPLVILGHHDPGRSDGGLEDLLDQARAFAQTQLSLPENSEKSLEIRLAREGMELKL
jgi:phosphoribosyl 1,2-cyclic phosphodiesterase